jgi:hypothetical protein
MLYATIYVYILPTVDTGLAHVHINVHKVTKHLSLPCHFANMQQLNSLWRGTSELQTQVYRDVTSARTWVTHPMKKTQTSLTSNTAVSWEHNKHEDNALIKEKWGWWLGNSQCRAAQDMSYRGYQSCDAITLVQINLTQNSSKWAWNAIT